MLNIWRVGADPCVCPPQKHNRHHLLGQTQGSAPTGGEVRSTKPLLSDEKNYKTPTG